MPATAASPPLDRLLIALLGGWPGAVAAQQWFRHKTSKLGFQIIFWFLVVYNGAALAWLASPTCRQYVRTTIDELRVNLTPAPTPAKPTKPAKPNQRRRAPSKSGWSGWSGTRAMTKEWLRV